MLIVKQKIRKKLRVNLVIVQFLFLVVEILVVA